MLDVDVSINDKMVTLHTFMDLPVLSIVRCSRRPTAVHTALAMT
jgi:hypothetical protein